MADGTFAALTFLIGLADMQSNYCNTGLGCFGRSEVTPRLYVSRGDIIKRRAEQGKRYICAMIWVIKMARSVMLLVFQSVAGRRFGQGLGQTYLASPQDSLVKVEFHAMTGLYDAGNGHDLGGLISFRSGIDLIYETDGGVRYALSYDHRSHTGIYPDNPGVESIQFAVSVPLK